MSQGVVIEHKKFDERLTRLEIIVGKIAEKVLANNSYGTESWWRKEITEAIREYKKGLGTAISSKKELDKFFDKLEAGNEN